MSFKLALPKLVVKRLHERAIVPKKATEYAAGYDLYSSEALVIKPRERAVVKTGISMAIPHDNYGRIAPRSGLAVKNGIDVGAGVVDSDYRGEVMILLFNLSNVEFEVKEGDRIAQLIIEKYTRTDLIDAGEDDLDETVRGAAGFGSTGISDKLNSKNLTNFRMMPVKEDEGIPVKQVKHESPTKISPEKVQQKAAEELVALEKENRP